MISEQARKPLALDPDTIAQINEYLTKIDDTTQPLAKLHGSVTLYIVKGEFNLVQVAGSYLLNNQKKRSA